MKKRKKGMKGKGAKITSPMHDAKRAMKK